MIKRYVHENSFFKKSDNMESSVPYHTILDITPISKWEIDQKYCMRIMTTEGQFLIQVSGFICNFLWSINSKAC